MNPDYFINLLTDPTGSDFITLFFKAFAVLFSVSYLVYAIVITRQTQEMNRTFTTKISGLLFGISLLQIVFSIVLIAASFFLI